MIFRTWKELERVHLLVTIFEPYRAFTKLLFELTQTSFFQTSNEFERVRLMAIRLEHPIFGLERSHIELRIL